MKQLIFILVLFSSGLVAQKSTHVCPGGSFPSVTQTCDGGTAPYTVTWTSPSGATSTGTSKVLNQAGLWLWQCTDSATPTCSSSGGTHLVVLEEDPTITITASSTCTGTLQTISATGVPAGYTYEWDFGSGATPPTSTTPFTNVLYTTAGAKTITLTITKTFDDPNIICTDDCTKEEDTIITIGTLTGTISCTP